ncbi:MAG TPA: hypothetical protein VNO20_02260 [Solirubrobacterales bacterium]|nr:hypothetical protein [Solirubrobacterales bacterium]
MRQFWVLGVLIVLVLVAAGCGSSEPETVTETVTNSAESSGATSETAEETTAPTSTTIPDGVWQQGRDYQPGVYRAPGGGSCYWALLGKANPGAIRENGGANSTQTLEINSPYFETGGCGTWEKIE